MDSKMSRVANRLATASAGAGMLAQYAYDAFGHRIVKIGSITATTLYQYDGTGHLLEENDGAGTSRVDYIYLDDQPVATIQPTTGKVYFLNDDRLGTPQLATDTTKTVVWTASYQPFGYTSTGIGAIVQNLRLPGQEFDVETGLYHNGYRDYAPSLGRYLQSDPSGLRGGMNTELYAYGNPSRYTDPRGLGIQVTFGPSAQFIFGFQNDDGTSTGFGISGGLTFGIYFDGLNSSVFFQPQFAYGTNASGLFAGAGVGVSCGYAEAPPATTEGDPDSMKYAEFDAGAGLALGGSLAQNESGQWSGAIPLPFDRAQAGVGLGFGMLGGTQLSVTYASKPLGQIIP